ncbi:DUF1127 domain-containing protein [Sneathiella sp. P13V-1]|uniref:DUF1127 domain-containing protein n=1 Tax=Sneathiella sp. P13V-1 TaxID=2697366 RepID=UPI00187BB651|nr:DUF1127 domain-containing protein [Sneathiella sp. P13V-1]MBE7635682.1 DUF1127 domain-containing protein [Sneathiella sp. P13V-1]
MATLVSKSATHAAHHGVFGKVFDSIVHAYRVRKTEAALYALDDRELADIGLSRGDIHNVSRDI